MNSFLFALLLKLILATNVYAHCPLCVAGAAAGITLTRWIGVDDSITGVWMGAFLGAISFWTYSAVNRKKQIPFGKPLIYLSIFGLTLWSFYKFQLVIRMSQIFGLDKLTFGILAGGTLFYLIDETDNFIIKRYGKVFFPYQRIVVSLGSILILSLFVYYLINYVI